MSSTRTSNPRAYGTRLEAGHEQQSRQAKAPPTVEEVRVTHEGTQFAPVDLSWLISQLANAS
jgi:hypothetical protein